MSRIVEIENAILRLSDSAFHRLCDDYLHKRGYGAVNSLGSVPGAEKSRRGTPDAFVPLANGKYLFAEYSTQQAGATAKLKTDIEKCLDEEKTGLPISKIEKIYCFYTYRMTVKDVDLLKAIGTVASVAIEPIGIDTLSHALSYSCPALAREHLGIAFDTNQILSIDEFVLQYSSSDLTIPLTTRFQFRDLELESIGQAISSKQCTIISGAAGLGKSRIAIEACRRYLEQNPDWTVLCILNHYLPLYDDLKIHISDPGKYLIFVDDANRLQYFRQIIGLVHGKRKDQQIRVVITIRSYAFDRMFGFVREYLTADHVRLTELSDDQILELVRSELGIQNDRYLDRIVAVARGNPRIALMMAKMASDANSLDSIRDLSALFEAYFASIKFDDDTLAERQAIKVAGIVAFYGAVDGKNQWQAEEIQNSFSMDPETFWDEAMKLASLEVFDLYEERIVRPSDQNLSTYLLYRALAIEKVLEFSQLLEIAFPHQLRRLMEALDPITSTFDPKVINTVLEPAVKRFWGRLSQHADRNAALEFLECFVGLLATEALIYIGNIVKAMKVEHISGVHEELSYQLRREQELILEILGAFGSAGDQRTEMAIGILLDYLANRPAEVAHVANVFKGPLGVNRRSVDIGLRVPVIATEMMISRASLSNGTLFKRLFLMVAGEYLKCTFEHNVSRRRDVLFRRVILLPEENLVSIRGSWIRRCLLLLDDAECQGDALECVRLYTRQARFEEGGEGLIKRDLDTFVKALSESDGPAGLIPCLAAQAIFRLCSDLGVPVSSEVRIKYSTEKLELYKAVTIDSDIAFDSNHDHEMWTQLENEKTWLRFKDLDESGWLTALGGVVEMHASPLTDHEKDQFKQHLSYVLSELGNANPELFLRILDVYLIHDDAIALRTVPVQPLIRFLGIDPALQYLGDREFKYRDRWILACLPSIPAEVITTEHLSLLLEIYERADRECLMDDFALFFNMLKIDKQAISKIVRILVDRSNDDDEMHTKLSYMLNPYTEVNKRLSELFCNDMETLEDAYLLSLRSSSMADYSCETLIRILGFRPSFIQRVLDEILSDEDSSFRLNGRRDFKRLWESGELAGALDSIIDRVRVWRADHPDSTISALHIFFSSAGGGDHHGMARDRQDAFLKELIRKHSDDGVLMKEVFTCVIQFEPDRRLQFFEAFLESNSRYSDFKALPMEMSWAIWSGSGSQAYEERARYFERLLRFMSSTEYLEHRLHIEKMAQSERESAEWHRKQDFMRDW